MSPGIPNTNGLKWVSTQPQGWTKYAERRILEAVEGPEVNLLSLSEGFLALEESISEFEDLEKREPGKWIRFTQLDPGEEGLGGVDPDVAYSRVPYEKGCLFLLCLESAVREGPWYTRGIVLYERGCLFLLCLERALREVPWYTRGTTWKGVHLPALSSSAVLFSSVPCASAG